MPIDFKVQDGDILLFRMSGELKISEFYEAQMQCEEIIKKLGA